MCPLTAQHTGATVRRTMGMWRAKLREHAFGPERLRPALPLEIRIIASSSDDLEVTVIPAAMCGVVAGFADHDAVADGVGPAHVERPAVVTLGAFAKLMPGAPGIAQVPDALAAHGAAEALADESCLLGLLIKIAFAGHVSRLLYAAATTHATRSARFQ